MPFRTRKGTRLVGAQSERTTWLMGCGGNRNEIHSQSQQFAPVLFLFGTTVAPVLFLFGTTVPRRADYQKWEAMNECISNIWTCNLLCSYNARMKSGKTKGFQRFFLSSCRKVRGTQFRKFWETRSNSRHRSFRRAAKLLPAQADYAKVRESQYVTTKAQTMLKKKSMYPCPDHDLA